MDNNAHYCELHNSKYYRNEKQDPSGLMSVWYSHKMPDGNGFCVEKTAGRKGGTAIQTRLFDGSPSQSNQQSGQVRGMLACNAMNNAVNLASAGAIQVDQISLYFRKIYSELSKVTV